MTSSGTQAIDRAADLLSRVVQQAGSPTAADLTAQTGYARSTTSRLLSALERNHLLRREDEGGWAPGALFEQYAAHWDEQGRLVRAATPVMEALGEVTGETINLGVGMGGTVVQIAQVDSSYFLGSRDWVGVDLPAHTSSLGKILYAHGVIEAPHRARAPLERLTSRTVTSWAELAATFDDIRTRGWASTVDELEVGLTGIAAPVHVDGRVVAGLGLSGPSTRLAHRIPAVGAVVSAHADDLSARLSTPARKVSHDAG